MQLNHNDSLTINTLEIPIRDIFQVRFFEKRKLYRRLKKLSSVHDNSHSEVQKIRDMINYIVVMFYHLLLHRSLSLFLSFYPSLSLSPPLSLGLFLL